MSQSKVLTLLFGVAAGVAVSAVVIGLLLVALAAALGFRADAASLLHQHPLFVSGSELIVSGLFAGLPLVGLWYARRTH